MTITKVDLSDGEECEVRVLGIFELDDIKADIVGPYLYQIETVDGRTYLAEYEGSRWEEPPKPPDKPEAEIEKGSDEWYDLVEHLRYTAWLAHEEVRKASMHNYHRQLARYVLENCISQDDRTRIVKPEDWAVVHKAAVVPELTLEALAETLRATFPSELQRHGNLPSDESGGRESSHV